jgi:hypothetical protein
MSREKLPARARLRYRDGVRPEKVERTTTSTRDPAWRSATLRRPEGSLAMDRRPSPGSSATGGDSSTLARSRSTSSRIARLWRGAGPFALGLAVSASASSLHADGGRVAIGDVSTVVGHAEVVPTIKATLVTELAKVKPPPGRSYVVNASLVKLETTSGSAKKQAAISFALRDSQGTLKGVVQGTASGERVSDRDLVEAAVKGGTKAVAEYVTK